MTELESTEIQQEGTESSSTWMAEYKPVEQVSQHDTTIDVYNQIDDGVKNYILNPSTESLNQLRTLIEQPGGLEALEERIQKVEGGRQ